MLIAVKFCNSDSSPLFPSFHSSIQVKICFWVLSENTSPNSQKHPKHFHSQKKHFPRIDIWKQYFQVRKQQKPKSQKGGGELNLVYEAMARRVPTAETHLIHPALSISLLAAWVAATIAIVAVLCGTRKKPTPSPSESSSVNQTTQDLETGSQTPATAAVSVPSDPDRTGTEVEGEGGSRPEKTQSLDPLSLPLPLPPIRRVNETGLNHLPRSVSVSQNRGGGFLVSASINLPRSFSVAKHLPFTKEERMQGRREKSKQSDSIWTKTIMLGERCRVPNEDEQIYDDKGQKIETYRPKGPRSLPVSRSNSFIDPGAVPG